MLSLSTYPANLGLYLFEQVTQDEDVAGRGMPSPDSGGRFGEAYLRRGLLSLAAAGGVRASCRPMASAIRRMRGSRAHAERAVVVGWAGSLPFLFLCHADAPSPGSIG